MPGRGRLASWLAATRRPRSSGTGLASLPSSGPGWGSPREPRLCECRAGFQMRKAAAGVASRPHYQKQTIWEGHRFMAATPYQVRFTTRDLILNFSEDRPSAYRTTSDAPKEPGWTASGRDEAGKPCEEARPQGEGATPPPPPPQQTRWG